MIETGDVLSGLDVLTTGLSSSMPLQIDRKTSTVMGGQARSITCLSSALLLTPRRESHCSGRNRTGRCASLCRLIEGLCGSSMRAQVHNRRGLGGGTLMVGVSRQCSAVSALDASVSVGLRSALALSGSRYLSRSGNSKGSLNFSWGPRDGSSLNVGMERKLAESVRGHWTYTLGPAGGIVTGAHGRHGKWAWSGDVRVGLANGVCAIASCACRGRLSHPPCTHLPSETAGVTVQDPQAPHSGVSFKR